MDLDPDLGVPLALKKRSAVTATTAPALADALDREADQLYAAASAAAAAAAAAATAPPGDDDEFAWDSAPTPSLAAAAPPLASSLVGAAAASDALGAVRAALAAAAEAEAARERLEREARVAASLLVGGGGAPEALAPVGEEEEEEEEEGEGALAKAAAVAAAAAAAAVPAAAPRPAPAPLDEEAAALEDAFAGATAATLQAVAMRAAAGGGAPAPPAILAAADAEAALLDAAALAPFFAGITPQAADPSAGCLGRLFAVRTPPHLLRPRDAVFALARRPYDGAAPRQAAVFDSIFALLTGEPSSAPGAAWTAIGFQREGDFSTDLRGVGMLGPLLVLGALQRHGGATRALWALATAPLHPFPVMVQCLALSAKALHALRLGQLNGALARGGGGGGEGGGGNPVLRLLRAWFAGLCADFSAAWRADPAASIMRIGHIQAAVVAEAYARPEGVLRRLEAAEAAAEEAAKRRAARAGT